MYDLSLCIQLWYAHALSRHEVYTQAKLFCNKVCTQEAVVDQMS